MTLTAECWAAETKPALVGSVELTVWVIVPRTEENANLIREYASPHVIFIPTLGTVDDSVRLDGNTVTTAHQILEVYAPSEAGGRRAVDCDGGTIFYPLRIPKELVVFSLNSITQLLYN